jgi:hypothetical protein
MELIKFVLSDFWIFLGFIIILSGIGTFIYRIINRALRHKSIMKWGYPPPHCDADGDFKEEDKDEDIALKTPIKLFVGVFS